jgi:phosphohistidine phosphatase
MKTLLLMRHAKSDRSQDGLSDIERPLNKRGRKASDALAAFLIERGLAPDIALVSIARRTQETFERMAATLGEPPLDLRRDLYLAEPQEILSAINSIGEFSRPLILGHNPGIEQAASLLAAPEQSPLGQAALASLHGKFPTGAIAVFRYPGIPWSDVRFGMGEILEFVTPASLAG